MDGHIPDWEGFRAHLRADTRTGRGGTGHRLRAWQPYRNLAELSGRDPPGNLTPGVPARRRPQPDYIGKDLDAIADQLIERYDAAG
jgi:hypothetical protein